MISISTAVKDFARYVETSKNWAAITKQRYAYEARRFASHLGNKPLERLTPQDLLGGNEMVHGAGGRPALAKGDLSQSARQDRWGQPGSAEGCPGPSGGVIVFINTTTICKRHCDVLCQESQRSNRYFGPVPDIPGRPVCFTCDYRLWSREHAPKPWFFTRPSMLCFSSTGQLSRHIREGS